ncbi:hypothetical protein EJ110_NYTH59392 [Nymphaea thermarum]|nr:hypothetical protein EJ110_NYTH59392 [Nymphaea thermarum]
MADEIITKTDMSTDAGISPKSENVPVQVTPIRLTKDNYLSWSAALEIGITSRGRLPYITGDKPAPSKTDPQWANWALEDSQVKVWIISSVSADIQPLILRKPTSFEMWNVLARMYGHKKRVLRTYQIKRSIYALKQGDLSGASYYAALKTKWEELDYHVENNWDCGSDHAWHWEMEWMDRTFLFLGGLRDEFESIRSQILNCDEVPGIEDVYARVESEEQRRQIMQIDPSRGSGVRRSCIGNRVWIWTRSHGHGVSVVFLPSAVVSATAIVSSAAAFVFSTAVALSSTTDVALCSATAVVLPATPALCYCRDYWISLLVVFPGVG